MKAVIITGPGFEDSELVYPYYRLLEEGFTVDVATKDKLEVRGKHGVTIKATIDTKDLTADGYDLVVIPGGLEAPDRVRQIPEVLEFVKKMYEKKRIVAAVCHGPWVLISAGIMRGKKATCYKGCKDDLINSGAEYIDAPVVVDGNIITSPHFKDMGPWMKEVLKLVKKK